VTVPPATVGTGVAAADPLTADDPAADDPAADDGGKVGADDVPDACVVPHPAASAASPAATATAPASGRTRPGQPDRPADEIRVIMCASFLRT
jgi:hypothetical protein